MPSTCVRDDRGVYLPPPTASSADDGAQGHTYGAAIIPADGITSSEALAALRGIRFSGWVAPPRDGWLVVIGDPGGGVVADGRRGVIEVAALLAQEVPGPMLAVRVRRDRQLALVAWRAGEEVARYCSDASREPGADEDVLTEPIGAEHGVTLAELWNQPDAVEPLTQLLEDELDSDSVYESERLGRMLRMLGLPAWLVAAGSLPRAMPTGPRPSEFVRLRAGRTGVEGRLLGAIIRRVRRGQDPPPVIVDPPKGGGTDFESWMF